MAGALWYGSQQIAAGRLTPGEFTSFIAALFLMYGPAKKLSRVNANLQQAIAASERIFEMLDTHTEVDERPGARAAARRSSARSSSATSAFGYDDGAGADPARRVVHACSAGQMVAIVGRSGAGKTTLVNLLPRFYDVSGGRILIDGVDIRDVTLASLRAADRHRHAGDRAVRRHDREQHRVRHAAARRREEIEAAARAANAHEFIVGAAARATRR